jgi:hypothetical protein
MKIFHTAHILLPGLLFLFAGTRLIAQENGYAAFLEKQFKEHAAANMHEKAFLHTDKENYMAGELMWFKLYLVDAATHMPSEVSKVAYVELLDAGNRPVLQAKLAVDKGWGSGSFFLPLTLETGQFRLRAYSSWMKNFSPDFYYEKSVPVINTLKLLPETVGTSVSQSQVAFFPEGGNLLEEVPAKVAFRIWDRPEAGRAARGYLLEDGRDTLLQFAPNHFGLGNFVFAPRAGHVYSALIVFPDQDTLLQQLPKPQAQGYSLRLLQQGDQLELKINAAGVDANAPLYVLAQSRQQVISVLKGNVGQPLVFSLQDLPEGITQFTLFTTYGQPVSARLYFKKPRNFLPLDMRLVAAPGTRQKITVQLSLADSTVTLPSLSLSVYRTDSFQNNKENLATSFWLDSDLTGSIASPAFYFSDSADAMATDNLMLTHGWSRLRWEDVLQQQKTPIRFAPELNGHLISGIVRDRNGRPLADAMTYLTVPGRHFRFAGFRSDAAGMVHYEMKDFYGPSNLIVQAADSFARVEILSPFSEEYSNRPVLPAAAVYKHQLLTERSISMQVQNWFHADSLKQFSVPEYDSLPFFGKPEVSYDLDLYKRFPTIEEVLREYVRQINVRIRNGKKEMAIVDEAARAVYGNQSLVLLDGIPVLDQSRIFAYDPLLISRVDLVNKKFYTGVSAFDGIASFITYNGDYKNLQLPPGALIVDYEGLQLQRMFYAPVYATEQQRNSRIPDLRELLYWAPEIRFDASGKAEISFYSSDQPGTYQVVLQGMDRQGRIVVRNEELRIKN